LELTSEYNMKDAYTQRTCTAQPALVENILRKERPITSAWQRVKQHVTRQVSQ